jgi:hypothetical protein
MLTITVTEVAGGYDTGFVGTIEVRLACAVALRLLKPFQSQLNSDDDMGRAIKLGHVVDLLDALAQCDIEHISGTSWPIKREEAGDARPRRA